MRRAKYRVDTYPLAAFDLSSEPQPDANTIIVSNSPRKQLLFEDRLDEFAEQGWQVVTAFVVGQYLWLVSQRSLWWRLMY